ncbi:MAG: sigma-70 family RNA polymerase sigma factor [Myxococcota bacterium]
MAKQPESRAAARGEEAQALVAAAKAGDPRAFEVLYARYRSRIYALALHLTGRPSDAEDVTQDAFLKAYARMGSFEGRSAFFTWLYRIALHRALNLKRDRGRRRTVGLDDPRVSAAVEVDAAGDPARALELQERYAQLLAAFDQLSESLRTTVVLTTLQGLSHKEAAVVLDTTEGTVSWRVHEARRRLRLAMEKLEKDPTPARFATHAGHIAREADPGRRFDLVLAALTSLG